jgi:transcription factor TGA
VSIIYLHVFMQVALKHVEPLSEGQILRFYNLQQLVHEREEALSHDIFAIQNTISDIVAAPEIAPANFMGHMSLAMNKAASMEGLVRQVNCFTHSGQQCRSSKRTPTNLYQTVRV